MYEHGAVSGGDRTAKETWGDCLQRRAPEESIYLYFIGQLINLCLNFVLQSTNLLS